MSRKNGGIIGPANTPVGGLITGLAGGVWRMNDVANFVGNSQWPKAPENIDNSLRFDDGSSDFLSKTFGSAGNQQIMTISFWMKRSDLSGTKEVISQGTGSACHINFQSSGTLEMNLRNSVDGASNVFLITDRLFKDVSAWYHIVLALDTTQGTASNRAKLYVNGVQETSFGTENYPSQNGNLFFNEASAMQIGEDTGGSNFNFDGYLAEFVFIDGQQLDPTSFGEFDTTTGIWKPKKIGQIANAGTNSFYLNFKDSSNVGKDESGLSNNFTVNNLTSIDQSTDTCVENYATWNPLLRMNSTMEFSDGNLTGKTGSNYASGASNSFFSTLGVSQGKWYAEFKYVSSTTNDGSFIGIAYDLNKQQGGGTTIYNFCQSIPEGYGYAPQGEVFNNGGTAGYSTYTTGDIIGVAMDLDNNTLNFYKNGSSAGSQVSITADKEYYFALSDGTSANTFTYSANFGNPPYSISSGNSDANGFGNFEYSVPSGYYALNTSNLNTYG